MNEIKPIFGLFFALIRYLIDFAFWNITLMEFYRIISSDKYKRIEIFELIFRLYKKIPFLRKFKIIFSFSHHVWGRVKVMQSHKKLKSLKLRILHIFDLEKNQHQWLCCSGKSVYTINCSLTISRIYQKTNNLCRSWWFIGN